MLKGVFVVLFMEKYLRVLCIRLLRYFVVLTLIITHCSDNAAVLLSGVLERGLANRRLKEA